MSDTNKLTNAIIDYLTLHGAYVWRNNTGAMRVGKRFVKFGHKGSSDVIGILPGGTFIGVEVKTGRDTPSDEQNQFKYEVKRRGGIAFVARNLDDVDDQLKGLGMSRQVEP